MKSEAKKVNKQVRWHLEASSDEGRKVRDWMVSIEPIPFVIGRDDDCSLKLNAKWISRRHAEIHKSSDHLWIRDLGSTNGTFVNNKRLVDAELLEDGDTLHFGRSKFVVQKTETKTDTLAEATLLIDLPDELGFADEMEPRLRKLISDRNVAPHFQPILRFSDMAVVGYEILGRIDDAELPTDTAELIDLAEYMGCGTDLSILFREVGVEVGRNLPGAPLLFANTTPFEMQQMDILLHSLTKLHDLAPSNQIVLEINERAAIDTVQTSDMVKMRNALKDMNITLAFDDFGVGQTRLLELAKVPPDYLKFDMSLIRQIHIAPSRLHQMVSTFVKAARDLGIATIAEGIECVEESDTCQELGFEFAQGFLYGRPSLIDHILNKP